MTPSNLGNFKRIKTGVSRGTGFQKQVRTKNVQEMVPHGDSDVSLDIRSVVNSVRVSKHPVGNGRRMQARGPEELPLGDNDDTKITY